MRRLVLLLAVVAVSLTLTFACPAGAAQKELPRVVKEEAPYVHVVLFTLKKDAPNDTLENLIKDCHELLAKIPTVRVLRVGRPAEKATEISKKDYQVGLMVLFDDYAGLKTYLDHEKHVKFVEKYLKHVEARELRVFDFENQKK